MRIAAVVAQAFAFTFLGGLQHGLLTAFAGKQLVNLLHRDAAVALDGDEDLARGLHAFAFGDAEEMPRGVFHVVAVHGLMHLELLAPAFEITRVIEREAALPKLRLRIRREGDQFVERGDGLLRLRGEKGVHALLEEHIRGVLGGNGQPKAEQKNGEKFFHGLG